MDLEPFERINPCGYAGLRNGRSSYNRRPTTARRGRGRAARASSCGARCCPPDTRSPRLSIRTGILDARAPPTSSTRAQTAANYDPTRQAEGRGQDSRAFPIKIVPAETLKKPDWIRVKAGSPTTRFYEIKDILREQQAGARCARKPAARTSANALARARRPS